MRALILGGTGFVGRHVGEALVAAGHSVTLLHRGRSNPGALPDVEHVLGDRTALEPKSPLMARTFDVVIDPSGYEVAVVRAAARAFGSRGARYVFVSSVSVYEDLARMDEAFGPVRTTDDAETAALTLANYGALKAACERALDEELPGRVMHVRAGLILGPHDYDARFRYWLLRVARGGEVLAPGDPEAQTQAIDARDLAAFICRCVEARVVGTFNVTGAPMAMRARLETVRDVVASDARFVWAPDELLIARDVKPYSEMPFWLPKSLGALPVPIARAVSAGLSQRPFVETARDTWAWLRQGWDAEESVRANRRFHIPAGLSDERERGILESMKV